MLLASRINFTVTSRIGNLPLPPSLPSPLPRSKEYRNQSTVPLAGDNLCKRRRTRIRAARPNADGALRSPGTTTTTTARRKRRGGKRYRYRAIERRAACLASSCLHMQIRAQRVHSKFKWHPNHFRSAGPSSLVYVRTRESRRDFTAATLDDPPLPVARRALSLHLSLSRTDPERGKNLAAGTASAVNSRRVRERLADDARARARSRHLRGYFRIFRAEFAESGRCRFRIYVPSHVEVLRITPRTHTHARARTFGKICAKRRARTIHSKSLRQFNIIRTYIKH